MEEGWIRRVSGITKLTDYLPLLGTAINKRPEQLLGILERSVKSTLLPRVPVDIDRRYERQTPADPTATVAPLRDNTTRLQQSTAPRRQTYRNQAQQAAKGTLTFLNDSVEFDDGKHVSLDSSKINEQSLHWKLKCWGFEHLKPSWLGYSEADSVPEIHLRIHRQWLEEWLDDGHPIAAEPGYLRRDWMPHSVSLRICNWSRYEATFGDELSDVFQRKIRRFILKNAAFLSNNVERGVGGNHLIENAVALVIAGSYFGHTGWLTQGRHILRRAAADQFFDDGGHIERSPMYHLIVAQRYLTSADLLSATNQSRDLIATTARKATTFANAIRPPDGKIPLLNDSTFDEALSMDELHRYARACGLAPTESPDAERRDRIQTGYYWLGNGDDVLLAVGGDLAVEHLPAHAHAHPAQILVWVDGQRVLTDTGVFEYAAGTTRRYTRSVCSHNTVQVDGTEPVRFGNSFHWFGNANTTVERDGDTITMAYDVNRIGQPSYSHQRIINYEADSWSVIDDVTGVDSLGTARFHIHPKLKTTVDGTVVRIEDETSGRHTLTLRLESAGNIADETGQYYPRYGTDFKRDVIAISRHSDGPLKTRIKIS